jgi:ribA/ribD-fused uncharacterized protein
MTGWAVIDRFAGRYAFLSNTWALAVPITAGRMQWPTVEHAFQAAKTTRQADRERIGRLPAASWRDAKVAGRTLDLRPGWEAIKRRVMLDLLILKFGADPDLAAQLAETGQARLVEGNGWHDQIWGDCRCGGRLCAAPGRNYLGRLLTAVRITYEPDQPPAR